MSSDYKRKQASLKVMPNLTHQEQEFVQEMISGSSYVDAWNRVYDPGEKTKFPDLTQESRKSKARALASTKRIKTWLEYLEKATPDELVEDAYVKQIAFGAPSEQLKAADAFLKSQFAGKEVAEIFFQRLQQVHAEIVIPCEGRLESVKL